MNKSVQDIIEYVIRDNYNKFSTVLKEKIISRAYGLCVAYKIECSYGDILDCYNSTDIDAVLKKPFHENFSPIRITKNSFNYPDSVLRFAPNPNKGPTLGNLKGLIIHKLIKENSQNCKLYLRFDDTDPNVKPPLISAYKQYLDAVKYFKVPFDEVIYASDRLSLYFKYAHKLMSTKTAVPLLDLYTLNKRKRSVTVKLVNADECILLRGGKRAHPRKPHDWIWPTLHFQSAIDDKQLGITHIFRGSDLKLAEKRQLDIYKAINYSVPICKYWGKIKIQNVTISSSKIKESFNTPCFSFWKRLNIGPEPLIEYFKEQGITETSANINLQTLCKYIKKKIRVIKVQGTGLRIARELFTNVKRYIFAPRKKDLTPSKWYFSVKHGYYYILLERKLIVLL